MAGRDTAGLLALPVAETPTGLLRAHSPLAQPRAERFEVPQLFHHKVCAPILGPRCFVVALGKRPFLT